MRNNACRALPMIRPIGASYVGTRRLSGYPSEIQTA
jgi:hypothetical protein